LFCDDEDTIKIRNKVFKMLKAEGKIVIIKNMMNWSPTPLPAPGIPGGRPELT
jgi:hypothetical protein